MNEKELNKKIIGILSDEDFIHNNFDSSDIESWKSLSQVDRGFLIKEMIRARNEIIVESFANKERVNIPHLGHFKIKDGRKIALEEKRKLLAEQGYSNSEQVDMETYSDIKEAIKKKVLEEDIKAKDKSKRLKNQVFTNKFKYIAKNTKKDEK